MNAERWDFESATRIVAGPGRANEIGELAQGHVLLVASRGATRRGLTEQFVASLGKERTLVHDVVQPNPTLERLDASLGRLRDEPIETIVAVGGGSAIDTGKVLSFALARRVASVVDLIADADESAPGLPLVAVPTTAGTGSEVTPFATVWDDAQRKKLSLTSPRMSPAVAVVDPLLTMALGWETTLSSGLDAYVQCFEAIANRNANPVTSALAEAGLMRATEALPRLRDFPRSVETRAQMSEAALFSGLAISRTRTALAHSMSYPLTAHLGVPHGLACALVFPAVLEFTLEEDDGRLESLARRSGLGGAHDLVAAVRELYRALDVADALRPYLPATEALLALAPEMLTPARAGNNLRAADQAAVVTILERAVTLVVAEPVR